MSEATKPPYAGRDRRRSTPYPMLRRKRRIWRRRSIRRRIRIVAVLAAIALAIAGLLTLLYSGSPPVDPAQALRRASLALEAGNYHAAHDQARQAAGAAPRSGQAQMMLARTSLLLGQGVTAEAALDRALVDGVPRVRTLADRAEARLLLGNVAGAQDAVNRMPAERDAAMMRVAAQLRARQGKGGAVLRRSLEQLVARFPNDARGWTDLGRSRFGAGDMDGATQAAARAVALAPADPAALTLQGEVVRARYGLTAGLPWFRAALARDAYYHPALIQYAATLGDLGRASDAVAATRTALISEPGSPEALYLQAVIAARAGQYALAQHALQLTGGALAARPSVALLDGALAYAQGRPQRAVRVWSRLVTMQPMNVAARRLLALAQIGIGDRAAALATLRPILSRADADGYALRLAAIAQSGDSSELIDRIAKAQRSDAAIFRSDRPVGDLALAAGGSPTDPTYALGLIRGLASHGDQAAALQKVQALVRASPGAAVAQMAYGDMLAVTGRMTEAVGPYARAANLTFDEPAMLRLIDAYQRIGQSRAAATALGLYLSQNSQSLPARRLLAAWQMAAGQWDDAIEMLEGLRTQLGPGDIALLHNLAIAYAESGDGVVARRYAAAAYRLDPMNAGVADAYGIALAANGEEAGARQLFDKALALAPGDPVILRHRAAL
ncbi:tetratricopeptide repeat protein [Sphingomonas sp. SORGH_AS_0879]|uniref:tetratricopeptide repeat protein n=1 Tax=Sphingomonas sp. SORGH_AS_0879 TaxID=3041790 RepID=UPI0027833351|nr:tetratricopeptide repeat protein [Sphingomonas sp. SORGH_AS_0879]MDQ1231052.1 Flp pilus assembly protein TadD [Sphingomonas sp. SORGH_AS_0879]